MTMLSGMILESNPDENQKIELVNLCKEYFKYKDSNNNDLKIVVLSIANHLKSKILLNEALLISDTSEIPLKNAASSCIKNARTFH